MRTSICAAFRFRALAAPVSAQVGPNIDDLAKELSNPGAANAALNVKLEYRTYDGDLNGANDAVATTLTFQPVLPFKLNNENNLIFRPSFSYIWDQPLPNAATNSVYQTNSWGDIPYDLLYSWSTDGWTFGAGVVGSIPTGSNISSDTWLLGPSVLMVRPTNWGIWGFFPFHNEKSGG
ncbi:MAG: hypothetical protein ABJH07_15465 [Sedimentitalea sp.]|uniref:hypothetical protein n=1 Tax=Sedimentitalea sp. TaxID=2048915 RepID=UPI0032653298